MLRRDWSMPLWCGPPSTGNWKEAINLLQAGQHIGYNLWSHGPGLYSFLYPRLSGCVAPLPVPEPSSSSAYHLFIVSKGQSFKRAEHPTGPYRLLWQLQCNRNSLPIKAPLHGQSGFSVMWIRLNISHCISFMAGLSTMLSMCRGCGFWFLKPRCLSWCQNGAEPPYMLLNIQSTSQDFFHPNMGLKCVTAEYFVPL